jgi:hypothetical protein
MMIFISDRKEIINEEEKLMNHENWTKKQQHQWTHCSLRFNFKVKTNINGNEFSLSWVYPKEIF